MNACCRKIPGYYATLGLHVSIAFAFAGLLASTTNMFIFPKVPTCAPGTTTSFSARTTAIPYCSSEALISSASLSYDVVGFLGMRRGSFSTNYGFGVEPSVDFCVHDTCDTLESEGAGLLVHRVTNEAGKSELREAFLRARLTRSSTGMPSVLEMSNLQNFTAKALTRLRALCQIPKRSNNSLSLPCSLLDSPISSWASCLPLRCPRLLERCDRASLE
jgi:hypothetical protein